MIDLVIRRRVLRDLDRFVLVLSLRSYHVSPTVSRIVKLSGRLMGIASSQHYRTRLHCRPKSTVLCPAIRRSRRSYW
jgi:hypothetical protein